MKTMTAKQLKNKTGEALRAVSLGQEVLVTSRGKPAAVILPPENAKRIRSSELRPFDEAWSDIESALSKSKPVFRSWQEALEWSRRRK